MIFLNPAVLLGLLAASIPVLIHLFNLRKLKRIEFSTLSFLKELQKNKIRKVKIKQWLLLALRVLIILFLVLGFARPTLEGVALGGTTSAAKTTAVFILDDTFSMSVVNANGSYLNQAKENIKELVGNLQEGDAAALILVSEDKNEIKTTTNLDEFIKTVDAVDISYSTGDLHSSIIRAGNILEKSDNFNKEIYLLSDFQKGRLAADETLSDLSNLLNENIKLYAFDFSDKNVFNLGIDELKINTQIFEKDKPVNFNLTVTNYSEQSVENSVISLFINGERSAQQSISLAGGESKIISIDAIIKSTGLIEITAELEDDEILHDNKRYTNLFIPSEIPVIIFSDKESDSRFVELALTVAENERPVKVTRRSTNQIASYDLSKFEVVFIIGSDVRSKERLISYVENEGALFLMPGSETKVNNFNDLLSSLKINSAEGEAGSKDNYSISFSFGEIDFQHPLFQNIFSNQNKKRIESPDIYYYFKINPKGNGQTIIPMMDGSAFLSEYQFGKGKILLFNSSPQLTWNNFPLKSVFVPLMNKSVFYLSFKEGESEEYFSSDVLSINLKGQALPQVKIERPDKTEDIINREANNRNYIDYLNTNLAGNYKVFAGSDAVDYISVNTNPVESKVEYLNENDLEAYLEKINFKGTFILINSNENPSEVIMQARFGSELWKYFIIFALILALVEMAIARSAKKELVEVT